MNATKKKIREYLESVTESTAKKIAAAIGMKDFPSSVVYALNEMRTDAVVECEKKAGKGNELFYWLSGGKVETKDNQPISVSSVSKAISTAVSEFKGSSPEQQKASVIESAKIATLEATNKMLADKVAKQQEHIETLSGHDHSSAG